MTADQVVLTGIVGRGHHGVYAFERELPSDPTMTQVDPRMKPAKVFLWSVRSIVPWVASGLLS